jgi:dienelactone hydrolase
MKQFTAIALSAIMLLSLTSCGGTDEKQDTSAPFDDARIDGLREIADALTGYLNAGDETSALALMDTAMQKAMKGKTAETWDNIAKSSGAFVETADCTGFQADGYDIIETTLVFEDASFIQRTVFGGDSLVAGLYFRPGAPESAAEEPPSGLTEEQITVDAGSGYPLDGLLTLPVGGAKAAVVLVHGSGPSDRDETIGINVPFRNIAYALAEKGIAVLRYDKRTLAYGGEIAGDPDVLAKLTVYDETVYDAAAAVNLAKERFDRVYILGHSMSGGLLAEIGKNGADADGYIVMSGTPRKLYEMSAEQNLLYADELEAGGDTDTAAKIRDSVQTELPKAARLAGLSDVDALKTENAVFSMSAWYLRSFEGINTIEQHLLDGKPILVLQGGRDRQVTETDFGLWKSGLKAQPAAEFRLYPALNHIMGEYKGEEVPFAELVTREYAQFTPVSAEVTDDIAGWILSQK